MQSEKIVKSIKEIEKNEKKSQKLQRTFQNCCAHNKHGSTDGVVELVENKNNPNIKTLRCCHCKKNDIELDPPRPEEMKKCLKRVETALTYVKFKLNTEIDEEDELCQKIGEFLDTADELYKVYDNTFRDSTEKNKRKNNDNRRDGATSFYIS